MINCRCQLCTFDILTISQHHQPTNMKNKKGQCNKCMNEKKKRRAKQLEKPTMHYTTHI